MGEMIVIEGFDIKYDFDNNFMHHIDGNLWIAIMDKISVPINIFTDVAVHPLIKILRQEIDYNNAAHEVREYEHNYR